MTREKLDDRILDLRNQALEAGREPVPERLQGVGKDRIRRVLGLLGKATDDLVDGVFALLDDQQPSWFSKPPPGAMFSTGATTAHLACHIGILQRGRTKLDREGRDYWIKPLRDLGAIEAVQLDPKTRTFVAGHPIAKSGNSAYRLSSSFKDILVAPEHAWRTMLAAWSDENEVRRRREFQATMERQAAKTVVSKHSDLIASCVDHYVPRFLPGYDAIYVDAGDGERISDEDRARLATAGIVLTLSDAMPDVLLWNPDTDGLWVVEAVTSDGEVDHHKVEQLRRLAMRAGKPDIGFTTAYATWKAAAARQGRHKNVAPGTYIWIQEDASKHFLAEAFPSAR